MNQIPQASEHPPRAISRQRLIHALGARWEKSLVLIEAPAGYGKSTALAQAMADNRADPSGSDHLVVCRTLDRDATALALSLARALDAPFDEGTTDPDELAVGIADALARRSPTHTSLIIDDVHRLPAGSTGEALLARLTRDLPANAHLVLAGRQLPRLPLTRYAAAGQVTRLMADDLALDNAEVRALADAYAVPANTFEGCAGWPAMARLTVEVGANAPIDFLIEEVANTLDKPTRFVLTAASFTGPIDTSVLERIIEAGDEAAERETGTSVAGGFDTPTLLATLSSLPLVAIEEDDQILVHEIWSAATDTMTTPEERLAIHRAVIDWHSSHGRHDEAVMAATEHQYWPEARRALMMALFEGDQFLTRGIVERWLSGFPDDHAHEPELVLLRNIAARLGPHPMTTDQEILTAVAQFRDRGEAASEIVALFEAGLRSWLSGDIPLMLQFLERTRELVDDGYEIGAPLVKLGDAAVADLSGRPDDALEMLKSIDTSRVPRGLAILVIRHAASLEFLVGNPHSAVEHSLRLLEISDDPTSRFMVRRNRFHAGDPEGFRDRRYPLDLPQRDNSRDDLTHRVYGALIDASFGVDFDWEAIRDLVRTDPRSTAQLALTLALHHVIAGDEAAGRKTLESMPAEETDVAGWGQSEVCRFLALAYVLDPEIRARLDRADLTPQHQRRRHLGRMVLGARAGSPVDWHRLPTPAEVFCSLPLRWSVELALAACAQGHVAGEELIAYLLEMAPKTVELLRIESESGSSYATAASRTLGSVPVPPSDVTRLSAIGSLSELDRDGSRIDNAGLRRTRVRELLALLIVRPRWTRLALQEAMWPKSDDKRAANNLRFTLSQTRQVLDADRQRGEASFHLRQRGDHLWLHRSDLLHVDLWEMQAALELASQAERDHRPREAAEGFARAVAAWTGPPLSDIRAIDDVLPDLGAIDMALVRAAVAVAEWSHANGDHEGALHMATRALDQDPFCEAAHRVCIAARLDAGDSPGAGIAVNACVSALNQLALDPSTETQMLLRRFERRRALS